jgi:hypothetical protein
MSLCISGSAGPSGETRVNPISSTMPSLKLPLNPVSLGARTHHHTDPVTEARADLANAIGNDDLQGSVTR